MKIRVPLTIEIDAAEWAKAQGLDDGNGKFTVADVRDDLRSYVLHMIQQSSEIEECGGEVSGA